MHSEWNRNIYPPIICSLQTMEAAGAKTAMENLGSNSLSSSSTLRIEVCNWVSLL